MPDVLGALHRGVVPEESAAMQSPAGLRPQIIKRMPEDRLFRHSREKGVSFVRGNVKWEKIWRERTGR